MSQRTLHLQLLPMSVPNPPQVGEVSLATWGALADTSPAQAPSLCLCPGEVGELVIRLEHCGDRPLAYRLQVNGSMPANWYTVHTEGSELQPGRSIEAVIRLRPDAAFFETRQGVEPGQMLNLDYQGEVRVYGSLAGESLEQTADLLANEPFRLFLRPRSLYPEFLPAVYREVDFIGRFLKIFEQSFEPAVNTLETLWAYLDPLTAPEALLPFLAQWVGWQNEAEWTVPQQRSLIRRAMKIYRQRGTRYGLQFYLSIYTGLPLTDPTRPPHQQPIQIQTASRRGFVLGETDLGPTAILGGGKPFHFSVKLCPNPGQWIDETLVRSIIDQEKPAVCSYSLEIAPIPLALAPLQETAHV
jgi:phage tail-like protein